MIQENLYNFFIKALRQIATDIVTLLPNIVLALFVFAVAVLIIGLLNRVFRRILKLVDLDGMFKRLAKIQLPFSLSNLIIALIDIGIILIAVFGIANLFLGPQHMELMKEVFGYASRIISVIAVTIITFIMFNVLIEKVRIETRMRGYIIFILLVLITMMVIDLSALSNSTKQALEEGLSIGLGMAVGVFALWFFFHDYLDKFLGVRTTSEDAGNKKLS